MRRSPVHYCAMTADLFLALLGFAFATSVTPGPNNLMLMASGANFGFRRTIPHMLGISVGFAVLALAAGLGLAGLLHAEPRAMLVLKVLAVGYMLWLASRIARAGAPGQGRAAARPMGFLGAAAFQWVNPKAWAMAVGAVTVYAPGGSLSQFGLVAFVFSVVNLPTVSLWAWAGEALRQWLSAPRRLRIFNWTMAGLLIASLWPVLKM